MTPNGQPHPLWASAAAEARLVALWNAGGHSMRTIASVLSAEFSEPVSTSTVHSKLARLGLTDTVSTITTGDDEEPRVETITLPHVGAAYAYCRGRLIRDGVALEARLS